MISAGAFLLDCRFALLALIGSEKESNDLCAGAAIVWPEQAITNAVGDAVLHRPCHSVCIVAIGKNIAELCLAIDQLTNGTEQESHALGTGAGGVRTEFAIARSCGDTVLHRPRNCLSIIAVRRNIREAAHALGFGRTGSTPQERDDLRTSAGLVGAEMLGVRAGGDAILRSPENCIIVIIAGLDVHEEVQHRVVVHEGHRDRDLGGGHGEGVLAVLLGELDFLAVFVRYSERFQRVALVWRDGNGHGITTLGVAAVGCYLAVPDVLVHLDGIGGSVVVATGGRLLFQRRNSILDSFRHCINFALLGNVLVTDNSIDGSFYSREVLVVVLVQSICLGNGFVDLGVVGTLVLHRAAIASLIACAIASTLA